MALESTHKAWKKIILLTVVMIICAAILCACDLPFKQYPFEKASYWSCDDPQIMLEYTKGDQGEWVLSEKIYWNNETTDISIAMRGNIYCAFPCDSDYYSDRLFSGKWKYRKGNLVLIIEEDFFFDGKYAEIILIPVATE